MDRIKHRGKPPARATTRPAGRWLLGCGFAALLAATWLLLLNMRPWSIPLYEDDSRTLASVQRAIPSGTTVDLARSILTRSGFGCAVEDDVPITEAVKERRLYCWEKRHFNRWRMPLIPIEWRVGLTLDADTVARTFVTSGVTLP